MLNKFCVHVYAQKLVFVIMSHVTFRMSHVKLRMSDVICQMLVLILGTCSTNFVLMSMLKSEYSTLSLIVRTTYSTNSLMVRILIAPLFLLNKMVHLTIRMVRL